jgi:DNA-binding transcriptional ArsR family regulator
LKGEDTDEVRYQTIQSAYDSLEGTPCDLFESDVLEDTVMGSMDALHIALATVLSQVTDEKPRLVKSVSRKAIQSWLKIQQERSRLMIVFPLQYSTMSDLADELRENGLIEVVKRPELRRVSLNTEKPVHGCEADTEWMLMSSSQKIPKGLKGFYEPEVAK